MLNGRQMDFGKAIFLTSKTGNRHSSPGCERLHCPLPGRSSIIIFNNRAHLFSSRVDSTQSQLKREFPSIRSLVLPIGTGPHCLGN